MNAGPAVHIEDVRSKTTGPNCFVIRTKQDLKVGGNYYQARKELGMRQAAKNAAKKSKLK